MKELKVIENELVPVYVTSTGEKVVYGTELFECLGSKRQYTDWIKGRLSECDAVESKDYQSFSQNNEKPAGGRPKQEYIIKLDTAKEMAMLERNEKGKQVRRYFIQVEKKYKKGISQKEKPNNPDRTKVMEMNARSRMAQVYLKMTQIETLSNTYKTILVAKAAEVLSGEQLLPLPKSGRTVYSAGEIGDMFNISANKVGRIANEHHLKTEEYGEYRRSKSEYSAKEIDTWVYFETVIPEIERILNSVSEYEKKGKGE